MKKFLFILSLFVISIIAVAIFTEKPEKPVRAPKRTVTTVKRVAEAPKVVEAPKKTIEEPKRIAEPPKKTVEAPKKAVTEPKKISEAPKKTTAPKKKTAPSKGFLESFKSMVGISKKEVVTPKKPTEIPKEAVVLPAGVKGKIAIVLDDWGYNLNNLNTLEEIEYPITLAILPNLPYSQRIAEEEFSLGREIMLHMPMEPMEKYNLEKNTILTTMTEDEIVRILDKDLSDIPHVRGINNHMGSKATSDARTMAIIFKDLKRRNLYFLDSFVTAQSICTEVSAKLNLKEFRRDVFLDNTGDPSYIKKQISILKAKASKNGFAVGIGHDRRNTLEALREEMPKAAKEGYKFVYLSDIER